MVRNIGSLLNSVARRGQSDEKEFALRDSCLVCGTGLAESGLYVQYRICHSCRFHYALTARERIKTLADPGTFRETNRSLTSIDPLSFSARPSYKHRLFSDQRRTGLTEAAVTGTCSIGGSPAVLMVLDFGFMGGSMGSVVGEKVALALELATKRKLPAVAVITSGGARIQEGVLSLMQMAKTAIASSRLYEKGLPFISVLANPATGQVYASFANLVDIILAEPGAIVGFAPLRSIKETSQEPLPHSSNTSESQLERGMVDAVVDRTELRDLLAVLLDLLGAQYRLTATSPPRKPRAGDSQRQHAWRSVQLARHRYRPSSLDYIGRIFSNFVELHGDRVYGDDGAIVCGLAHLGGQTVAVIGHERGRGKNGAARNDGRVSPEGLRKAQRVLHLASKFNIPLVTLIDTPGPILSLDAEERGLGNAIATTMALMSGLRVPSIAAVIGEGGSEAAIALAVADRVLMMENAIYSIMSPEDAADLIYQDENRAEEVAEALRLTAHDCRELDIVDIVVQEPPGGAHNSPDEAARNLRRVLLRELAELQAMSKRRLLNERYKKFREVGRYSSRFRAAIAREVDALQGFVATGVRRIARRRSLRSDEAPDLPDVGGNSHSLS